MANFIFQKTLIIGVGLIGSSIARHCVNIAFPRKFMVVDTSDDVLKNVII